MFYRPDCKGTKLVIPLNIGEQNTGSFIEIYNVKIKLYISELKMAVRFPQKFYIIV